MSDLLSTRMEGRTNIITIAGEGRLCGNSGKDDIRHRLMEIVERSKFIIIDISGFESMSWDDLGLFVSIRQAHRARWGVHMHCFKIVVRPGKQRVMIESMHMESILATFRSLPEALATMPRKRALHLEPEDNLASVVEILLEANGFEVIRLASPHHLSQAGKPVPNRAELGNFDIVITELSFEGFEGFEGLKGRANPDLVRQLRLEFGAPVGVVTADPPEQILGAAFVLCKPIIPEILLKAIGMAMEQPLHQYYHSIFDSLPTAICIVSIGGALQCYNPAWSQLFRVAPNRQACVADRSSDIGNAFPPDYPHLSAIREKVMRLEQGLLEKDDPNLVVKKVEGDYELDSMRFLFTPLASADSDPHILITVADAPQHLATKAMEPAQNSGTGSPGTWSAILSLLEDLDTTRLELSGANQRLQGLDRMKDEFISTVSHELRTPIAAIKGSIENLLDGYLGNVDPRQKRVFEIVLRNSRRLARIIDNLLDLSRLDAGTLQLRKSRSDLRDTVRCAVEEIAPIAEKLGAGVTLDLPKEVLLVKSDRDRLEQVMINLLDNALRFSQGKVAVRLAAKGKNALIHVEDNGSGIPEADIPRLFDRFSHVKSASGLSHTGLGLSIVRGIVEEHGGHVWAENRSVEEGGGARFVVCLPLPSDDREPDHPAVQAEGERTASM